MKYKSIYKFILLGFIISVLASSCVKEGPMGPAGADGKDGADGTNGKDGADGQVTCLACHGSNLIETKQAEFAMSEHKAGAIAVAYAGGRKSCARCHSHEGFVQFAEFGKVLGNIQNPSAWKCSTCHGLHKTFESGDFALRLTAPFNPIYDPTTTIDLGGNSNLCGYCHQSRRAEPNVINPGEETFKITSVYYGPHHGPQANLLAGVGFAEIPGTVQYPEAGSNFHLQQASCNGCHMGTYGNGGGHSWIPNLDACSECHGVEMINFDYGGVQSNVQSRLDELRDKLVQLGVVAWEEEAQAYKPIVGTYPMDQARAFFNWVGISDDRSEGVHNPKYVNALLINSIDALDKY